MWADLRHAHEPREPDRLPPVLLAKVRSSPDQPPPNQPMLVRPLSAQELAAKTMAACTDPLVKKQLGYLLGRQGVVRPCQHNHSNSLCWHVRGSPWQLPLSAGQITHVNPFLAVYLMVSDTKHALMAGRTYGLT